MLIPSIWKCKRDSIFCRSCARIEIKLQFVKLISKVLSVVSLSTFNGELIPINARNFKRSPVLSNRSD